MATVTAVRIANLALDGDIQPPMRLNSDTVETYLHAWMDGAKFPPIVVFRGPDGGRLWLADGFHRVRAAELAGIVDIMAEVHAGGKRDALLYAAGSNANHGLQRTPGVKKWYLRKLLEDAEWSKLGRADLARICRVRETLVEQVQTDLFESRKPREITPETRAKAVEIAEAGGQPQYVETETGIDVIDATPPADKILQGTITRRDGSVSLHARRSDDVFFAAEASTGANRLAVQQALLAAARAWAEAQDLVLRWETR